MMAVEADCQGHQYGFAITDTNGNYELFQLPTGQYTVEFTAPGGYVMDEGESAIAQTIPTGSQTLAASAYQPAANAYSSNPLQVK